MNEYPGQVFVRLTPKEFLSTAARNRHFNRLAEIVRTEAKVATGKIERECDKSLDGGVRCREAIRNQRNTRLGELDRIACRRASLATDRVPVLHAGGWVPLGTNTP